MTEHTTNNFDETQLTAYALGELDAAEAAEVEAFLADNPGAQQTVNDVRRTAELLTKEFAGAEALALTDAQRQAVETGPARSPAGQTRRRLLRIALSAAAVLIVGFGFAALFLPHLGGRIHEQHRVSVSEPGTEGDRYLATGPSGGEKVNFEASTPTETATAPSGEYAARISGRTNINTASPEVLESLGYVDHGGSPPPSSTSVPARVRPLTRKETEGWADYVDFPTEAVDPWLSSDRGLLDKQSGEWNREAYDYAVDNPFRDVGDHPLSTFSIDVDTASYSNTRRMLQDGQLPPAGAVRIEEMVNYFEYSYAAPTEADEHPFRAYADVSNCPWNAQHALLRVALKGREIEAEKRPAGNYVFLLDVSGSMNDPKKLPLVQRAMIRLVEELDGDDRLAIVVYAGAAGLVLDSTACDKEDVFIEALERLQAGGSTQGSAGIQLAYEVASRNFIDGGVNRVILCTDGDFNVGITNESDLVTLIEDKAKSGVFLTVLGFGMGNYQDSRLEKLADKGNGNYGYVDSYREARRLLVDQMSATLITIAKDVKIQIEFNPANVAAYRLIGYENRILAKEDFNDDTKDAGEIGAGHTVTALYEVIPAGQPVPTSDVDPLRYQHPAAVPDDAPHSDELLTLKLRYKAPDGDVSTLMEIPVANKLVTFDNADRDFQFAAAVAAFGMILRDSPYKGTATLDYVLETAQAAQGVAGEAPDEHRAEFVELVKLARDLMNR